MTRKIVYSGFDIDKMKKAVKLCRLAGIESRTDMDTNAYASIEYEVYVHGMNSWDTVDKIKEKLEKGD